MLCVPVLHCVRAVCLSSCEKRPQHTAQEPQTHQKFESLKIINSRDDKIRFEFDELNAKKAEIVRIFFRWNSNPKFWPPFSCCCSQKSDGSGISVALLPSSKPNVRMLLQVLSLLSTSFMSICCKIVRQTQSRLASMLCTQIPLVCPSSLSMTSFFGTRTMMFLSHVSMSSLFNVPQFKGRLYLLQNSPRN